MHFASNRVDHQFMGMLDSYRACGGLARVQEVFTIHKSKHGKNYACLARAIVNRELLSFDWQSHVWIPLFQFDRSNMTRLPGLAAVLETLNPDCTAWSLALWFAKPNDWLRDHSPASILGTDAGAVLAAARARHLNSL